jgi:hypothetical protein
LEIFCKDEKYSGIVNDLFNHRGNRGLAEETENVKPLLALWLKK